MPKKSNNVATRNIILVSQTTGMGVKHNTRLKLLTVGKQWFMVRILNSGIGEGGLLTLQDKYPITNDKVIYNSRWPTYYKIIEGMDKVLEIHKELYGDENVSTGK